LLVPLAESFSIFVISSVSFTPFPPSSTTPPLPPPLILSLFSHFFLHHHPPFHLQHYFSLHLLWDLHLALYKFQYRHLCCWNLQHVVQDLHQLCLMQNLSSQFLGCHHWWIKDFSIKTPTSLLEMDGNSHHLCCPFPCMHSVFDHQYMS
jgi:hypothetical protein